VYWLCCLTPEIDDIVDQLHASRKMVEKYDQLRAQNKITTDEATCLQDEKTSALTYQSRLRDKLTETMEIGTGMFRGVQKDAASLGKNLSEILKKLFAYVVPFLYPKLEMGARPLKGNEAEQILKAADLKALPTVFSTGDHGLGLVVKDSAKNVINTSAPVAKGGTIRGRDALAGWLHKVAHRVAIQANTAAARSDLPVADARTQHRRGPHGLAHGVVADAHLDRLQHLAALAHRSAASAAARRG
jgi:hypothetical protein